MHYFSVVLFTLAIYRLNQVLLNFALTVLPLRAIQKLNIRKKPISLSLLQKVSSMLSTFW